jgi:hypothetical protein
MENLELAWDTFNFYASEVAGQEAIHINNMNNAKLFINKNKKPTRGQKKRLKSKCLSTISLLLVLYNKQMASLDDLIKLHSDFVDIPEEFEIDVAHLVSLKNITATLIHELSHYKNQLDDLLS